MSSKTDEKETHRAGLCSGHIKPDGLQIIKLPKPAFKRGKSLAESLKQRRTIRALSNKKIPLQLLSNILWAAYGVNRKSGPFGLPGRTAASASNSQEIDIYVALREGIYLYDAFGNSLKPVKKGDFRKLALGYGQRNFITDAPVQFIYVADLNKLINTSGFQEPGLHDPEVQKSYYYADTGLIAENVYLFAAAYNLAAWFHNCDKLRLKSKLKLRPDQRILFGQSVGYPEKG